MKEIKLASRYAKALFDFSIEQDVLEQVKDDMKLVVSVCKQNSRGCQTPGSGAVEIIAHRRAAPISERAARNVRGLPIHQQRGPKLRIPGRLHPLPGIR